MTRQVTESNVTVEVFNAQTNTPLAGVTVTVAPAVYTTPEFTGQVTSLTTRGDGAIRFYAPPGVYTFTAASPAAPIEPVEVLGGEQGAGIIDGGSP